MKTIAIILSLLSSFALATVNQNNVQNLSASSTNIPTASYVQLVASTSINCSRIFVVNTTASIVKVAYGASGSETDLVSILPSGQAFIDLASINILPLGTRIALEAVGSAATTGYVSVSLLP